MKTQKIFLLVLVLVLALGLASCGDAKKSTAPDCFVFDEQGSFDDSVELKGEIIEINSEHNLIALENVELDNSGLTKRTVEIFDASEGDRVLFRDSVTTSPGQVFKDRTYDLSNYPLIGVTRYSENGTDDGGAPKFESYTDYYLIDPEKVLDTAESVTAVASSLDSENDDVSVSEVNNLYLAALDGKVYWINENLKVMRTLLLDVSNTYEGFANLENFFGFDAEHEDYLYTYTFDPESALTTIIVYAPNGVASAQYNFTSGTSYIDYEESIINPKMYVLNDGKVLIQECIAVEKEDTEYDFVYGSAGQKFNLVTKVMNQTNGAVAEIDFDYLIKDFESSYAHEDGEGYFFKLADGYDNQALLVSVADGTLGKAIEYVVLSNDLERQYTLNNPYLSSMGIYSYETIKYSSEEGYIARAFVNGSVGIYRFDWDGNVAFAYPTNVSDSDFENGNGFTFEHYVTDSGIYRNDGTPIFDTEGFEADDVTTVGDAVYVMKSEPLEYDRDEDMNIVGFNAVNLTYKIDLATGEAVLIADSSERQHFNAVSLDGAYAISDVKKRVHTICNKNGETVLVVRTDDIRDAMMLEDAYVLTTFVGGEYKTYVMPMGDASVR